MKRIVLIIAGLVCAACSEKKENYTFACEGVAGDYLSASYILREETRSKNESHDHAEDNAKQVTLWRMGARVAHQSDDPAITVAWAKDARGYLMTTQFFNEHQRAIEYEATAVANDQQERVWTEKWQIVSPSLIAKMQKIDSYGEGCNTVDVYTLEQDDVQATLHWLASVNLPALFEVTNKDRHTHWTLEHIAGDKAAVTQQFTSIDDYDATDYADVGDNETDPFLRRMINLGFIEHGATGFYDTEGNNLGDGHAH